MDTRRDRRYVRHGGQCVEMRSVRITTRTYSRQLDVTGPEVQAHGPLLVEFSLSGRIGRSALGCPPRQLAHVHVSVLMPQALCVCLGAADGEVIGLKDAACVTDERPRPGLFTQLIPVGASG